MVGCVAGSYVPPASVSILGIVTVSEPGFTVPAKVVPTAGVVTPILMVPSSEPIASSVTVPVITAEGVTVTVPVAVAPVTAPILAVPPK